MRRTSCTCRRRNLKFRHATTCCGRLHTTLSLSTHVVPFAVGSDGPLWTSCYAKERANGDRTFFFTLKITLGNMSLQSGVCPRSYSPLIQFHLLLVYRMANKKTFFEVNHALPGNVLRSKIEWMEHLHFLRVTPQKWKNVAYLLLGLFPCNRITLEVRM